MCFSATASFTAASVLTVIGCFALKKAGNTKIYLLALFPLFFGLQQAFEGIVWITLNAGDNSSLLHMVGIGGFLFFASLFWPIWVPTTFYVLEKNHTRKKILRGSLILGFIVIIVFAYGWITKGMSAHIDNNHIVYPYLSNPFSSLLSTHIQGADMGFLAAYLIATIIPFFCSSLSLAWLVGLIIAIGYICSQIFYYSSVGSTWCFFAGLASVLIYFLVVKTTNK